MAPSTTDRGSSAVPTPPPLRLRLVSGPALTDAVEITGEHVTLGRGIDCQVVLAHETVSRRHAAVARVARQWFVTDLGSRHGTTLNGVPITASKPASLEHDDMLGIGPWIFRVDVGQANRTTTLVTPSMIDAPARPGGGASPRVERVPDRELAWSAQQRLDLLISASAAIYSSSGEAEMRDAALQAACAGTGYARAAWLRPAPGSSSAESIELLASRLPESENPASLIFSQSLLREASQGRTARLTEQSTQANYGQSIADLGIHSALCVPISVGSSMAALLYLDARGQESPVSGHAAGFCQALSQICGLAIAGLRREELERRQERLDLDLAAAREAQQFIMPPAEGTHRGLVYAMRATPGRAVAGDLFDVIRLDDHRLAIFIGDVAGKSIGAGLLMATTQAYLHAMLVRHNDPALALRELNVYLCARIPANRFITMWVGIIDARSGRVVYVDAGHGHALLVRRAATGAPPTAQRVQAASGIPVGIDAGFEFAAEDFTLAPGDRLVLYSDGIHEQRSPTGEEFGLERVRSLLAESQTPHGDVQALFAGVKDFATTASWDDDATVASIAFSQPN